MALLAGALSACTGVSPTQALDDADRKQLVTARTAALEGNKTGQATNWSNPKSGARGTVVPTHTYKSADGADCREFQQTTTIAGKTDLAFGASCRGSDGAWAIVSGPTRFRPGDDVQGRFGYGVGYPGGIGYPYFSYGRLLTRW